MLFDTIKENQVTIDLTFLKPWKSKAKVSFNLSSKADETTVEWVMDSQLPFFLFWMKKSMQAYIGMDYTRGLTMLKDYIELGAVPFTITVDGFKERNTELFIGKHGQCTMEEVGQRVSADFQALMPYLFKEHKALLIDYGFTMYSKWDAVKNRVMNARMFPRPVSTRSREMQPLLKPIPMPNKKEPKKRPRKLIDETFSMSLVVSIKSN